MQNWGGSAEQVAWFTLDGDKPGSGRAGDGTVLEYSVICVQGLEEERAFMTNTSG